MARKSIPSGVYVLYSKGEVVYIGQSDNIYNRISQHFQEGVKEFDSFDIYETPDRKALESFLINAFHPKYNTQNGGYLSMPLSTHEPYFTQPALEDAVKSFEKKPISVGRISDIYGIYSKPILSAILNHRSEVPAWKHAIDGCFEWEVDYEWFKENSDLLLKWALEEDGNTNLPLRDIEFASDNSQVKACRYCDWAIRNYADKYICYLAKNTPIKKLSSKPKWCPLQYDNSKDGDQNG